MNCPKHPDTEMEKIRLDVYGCPSCGYQWLIHPYKNKKYSACVICEKRILEKDLWIANEPGAHPGILGPVHAECYDKAVEAQPDLPWTDPISGQVDYREMGDALGFSDPEEDMGFENEVY